MKTRNRILSLLVLLCLLAGLLPSVAFAATEVASGTCGDNLTWVLDNDGTLTISGTGKMTSFPWTTDYNDQIKTVVIEDGVTSICDHAFSFCFSLTSVTIPDGVTSIGGSAFKYCTSLTGITIPDSVTSIGELAFCDCTGLTSIAIPDSVTSIGEWAFFGCAGLTSIAIPDSVTMIGNQAFEYCTSLTGITIPDSVTSIGEWVFSCCLNLTAIEVDPGNANYCSQNGVLFSKDMTELIACPGGKVGEYVIPDSVTMIGNQAFEYCTSLTGITIPSSVISIGERAFVWCVSLTVIEVDPGNANYCSQNSVLFSKDMTELIACPGGKVGEYVIPDSVISIGERAFLECRSLTAIEVGPGNANYCSQNGVLFSKDMTELVACPGGKIGEYVIPDSVTSICEDAFYDCDVLTSVTIPASVTTIGNGAFSSCDSLIAITFEGNAPNAPEIGSPAFGGTTVTAYYPAGNETWTEDVMQDYGGTITWTPCSAEIYADGYDFYTDSYNFVNYGEKISKKYFTTFYEDGPGTLLYKLKKNVSKSGLCFGMAYTTAAIYSSLPDCSRISTLDDSLFQYKFCDNIREIVNYNLGFPFSDICSAFAVGDNTISVEDYIKYAFIYQWSSEVAKSSDETWGDIEGLYNTVKSYTDAGIIGVTIGLTHYKLDSNGQPIQDSGHEVLAVGYEGKTILVDDPNNKESIERLVIKDDWSWTYSGGWTSDGVTSLNSVTDYQVDYYRPYEVLLTGNSASTKYSTDDKTETYIEGMEEIDASSLLAYIDCEAISELPQNVIEVVDDISSSTENATDDDGMLYWVENANSLSLSEISGEDNEIILAGGNAILSANFGCVTDYVGTIGDDDANIRFDGTAGEGCTVTYTTVFNDMETELEISGEIKDASVEVRTVDGGVEVLGLSRGTVTITTNDITSGTQDFQADTNVFTVYYDEQGEDTTFTISDKTDDEDDVDEANDVGAGDSDSRWGLYFGIAAVVVAVAVAAVIIIRKRMI